MQYHLIGTLHGQSGEAGSALDMGLVPLCRYGSDFEIAGFDLLVY